jgi:hypothetical protein
MAIHRDHLKVPSGANDAVARLLSESPGDGEALDLVLEGHFDAAASKQWIAQGRDAAIAAVIATTSDVEPVTRLAEIATHTGDVELRQVVLGIRAALGSAPDDVLQELATLDRRIARKPKMAITDEVIESIRDPRERGPISRLFVAIAPTIAEAVGPGLNALGVGRRERVKAKDGLPLRNEVAAWAGALGLGEFEFYHGGREPDGVVAIPLEIPVVVIGTNVQAPLEPRHRAALVRERVSIKLGTSCLRHRDPSDVAAIIVAACRLGGAPLDAPSYAMTGEFERQLGKVMPRRIRKDLPELVKAIGEKAQDPVHWVRAATSTLDRAAAIAVGDVSWVLLDAVSARGEATSTAEGAARASRLMSFVLSPHFSEVRHQLGLEVR